MYIAIGHFHGTDDKYFKSWGRTIFFRVGQKFFVLGQKVLSGRTKIYPRTFFGRTKIPVTVYITYLNQVNVGVIEIVRIGYQPETLVSINKNS